MEREIIYMDRSDAGEERVVELGCDGSAIELAERTSGPDTEMVFGDSVHITVLRMGEQARGALLEALGGGELASALRRLFAVEEGAWLSDVQDMLDRAGEAYARASYGPGGALYRPPYFA